MPVSLQVTSTQSKKVTESSDFFFSFFDMLSSLRHFKEFSYAESEFAKEQLKTYLSEHIGTFFSNGCQQLTRLSLSFDCSHMLGAIVKGISDNLNRMVSLSSFNFEISDYTGGNNCNLSILCLLSEIKKLLGITNLGLKLRGKKDESLFTEDFVGRTLGIVFEMKNLESL